MKIDNNTYNQLILIQHQINFALMCKDNKDEVEKCLREATNIMIPILKSYVEDLESLTDNSKVKTD